VPRKAREINMRRAISPNNRMRRLGIEYIVTELY